MRSVFPGSCRQEPGNKFWRFSSIHKIIGQRQFYFDCELLVGQASQPDVLFFGVYS